MVAIAASGPATNASLLRYWGFLNDVLLLLICILAFDIPRELNIDFGHLELR